MNLLHPHLAIIFLASLPLKANAITYDDWKSIHFNAAERANSLISGEAADPDRDSVDNLTEYALGRDPKVPEVNIHQIVGQRIGGVLTVIYPRLKGVVDVDYLVEVSNDMSSWKAGYGNAWTVNITDNGSTENVTAVSLQPTTQRQFIRLKVVETPRATVLASITTNNSATNNDPTHLLDLCTVKSGVFAGGIVRYPMRPGPNSGFEDPNYVLNWYHANIALYPFVETDKARVLAYMQLYLNQLNQLEAGQSTLKYRPRDVDLLVSNFSAWHYYHPDSDDAYAGTFLLLAGKYRRTYPSDTWFQANLAKLKNIAYHNILLQIKSNGLTRTFQDGVSSASYDGSQISNSVGYLMDNVQAWAGLNELVLALEADPNETASERTYYRSFRDALLLAIHSQLWDSVNSCWKPADATFDYRCDNVLYAFPPFYPHIQCQYFPELYDLPYPGDSVETQRRYNFAWTWLESNFRTASGVLTPWTQSAAWWTCDPFSHVDIAVVAAKRGDMVKVQNFLQMANLRWLPNATAHHGTVSDQIGYWNQLTRH
jgi:hypothetical protein